MSTPVEYQNIRDSIPYDNGSLEDAPFPKCFPFSAMVPWIFDEVKEIIMSYVKFSEDLN